MSKYLIDLDDMSIEEFDEDVIRDEIRDELAQELQSSIDSKFEDIDNMVTDLEQLARSVSSDASRLADDIGDLSGETSFYVEDNL